MVPGALMVAKALRVLWIGWPRCRLATSFYPLYTFSFLTLPYFAAFSIVAARAPLVLGDDAEQGGCAGSRGGNASAPP